MKANSNIHLVILLSLFNLLFPFLGVILILIAYFFITPNKLERKLIYLSIAYAMGFLAYSYVRIDETGDVFRYGVALQYYKDSLQTYRDSAVISLYEMFYPIWYSIFYIVSKLGLELEHINFLAGFTIYSSVFYIVYRLHNQYNARKVDKILVLKYFLFFSFIGLFSSYKTAWSFSLVAVGIYKLSLKERFGWLFLLLGMGIHPISWVPVIAFIISKFLKFKNRYLVFSLIMGLFLNQIIIYSGLLSLPFIGAKLNYYIYGEWGYYRFHERGEYVKFFLLYTFIVFLLIVFFKKYYKSIIKNKYKQRYDDFIGWYFVLSLMFLGSRTLETRLLLEGFVFFIPFIYYTFANDRIYKKNVLPMLALLLWTLMIDIRTFNYTNHSYMIGSGFPTNLLDSPLMTLFNN